jgi:uncharacterized membrane protein
LGSRLILFTGRNEAPMDRLMNTSRLEAFSDGVLAIIITITILELHTPSAPTLYALVDILPSLLIYVISFITIGVYWNNHHHLLKLVNTVDGKIMWLNLHLLFWLSLIPLTTIWFGDYYEEAWPTAIFSFVMLMSALAYTFLQMQILKKQVDNPELLATFEDDKKGRLSLFFYVLATGVAFIDPIISYISIALVTAMWFVPDRRITKFLM